MRVIGLDPGLRHTGWGVIEAVGNHLSFVACGCISPMVEGVLSDRLKALHDGLRDVLMAHDPNEAAVEETFLNKNPNTTLKLGQARGIALLVPALYGLPVTEYAARSVKQTVVGTGAAAKEQVQMMVRTLLPGCNSDSPDAADALAVAICHAHHVDVQKRWGAGA